MSYFYKPTGQAYSSEQIQGLIGVDPKSTNIELLNALGVFPISHSPHELDPFAEPFYAHFIDGESAQETPSGIPVSIGEAREKCLLKLKDELNVEMTRIRENLGLSLESFTCALALNTSAFPELSGEVFEAFRKFEADVSLVENASSVEEIKVLYYRG